MIPTPILNTASFHPVPTPFHTRHRKPPTSHPQQEVENQTLTIPIPRPGSQSAVRRCNRRSAPAIPKPPRRLIDDHHAKRKDNLTPHLTEDHERDERIMFSCFRWDRKRRLRLRVLCLNSTAQHSPRVRDAQPPCTDFLDVLRCSWIPHYTVLLSPSHLDRG
jgi:hypothetical protein